MEIQLWCHYPSSSLLIIHFVLHFWVSFPNYISYAFWVCESFLLLVSLLGVIATSLLTSHFILVLLLYLLFCCNYLWDPFSYCELEWKWSLQLLYACTTFSSYLFLNSFSLSSYFLSNFLLFSFCFSDLHFIIFFTLQHRCISFIEFLWSRILLFVFFSYWSFVYKILIFFLLIHL